MDAWDALEYAPKHAIIALFATIILAAVGMLTVTVVSGRIPSPSLEDAEQRRQVLRLTWFAVATVAGIAAEVWLFRQW